LGKEGSLVIAVVADLDIRKKTGRRIREKGVFTGLKKGKGRVYREDFFYWIKKQKRKIHKEGEGNPQLKIKNFSETQLLERGEKSCGIKLQRCEENSRYLKKD